MENGPVCLPLCAFRSYICRGVLLWFEKEAKTGRKEIEGNYGRGKQKIVQDIAYRILKR
jgi:hypothetical protein